MIVCVPIDPNGMVDPRWGRADRIVVVDLIDGEIESWREIDVSWSTLHDSGSPARHHARVARFLKDNSVEMVVADHVGDGMVRMLGTMNVPLALDAAGDARAAVLAAGHRIARS